MKEKECGAKLQLIENTCCMILPEELRKMDSGQFANRRLMQKLERLLHNLIKKFGMYHIAVNLPPDSSHDIIRLMNKTLEKYQDISLYLVGESEIQGIRYGQDRKNIEKELVRLSMSLLAGARLSNSRSVYLKKKERSASKMIKNGTSR